MLHRIIQFSNWVWDVLPSFVLVAIGVISFLSGFWQNAFSEWEVKHKTAARSIGVLIGLILMGAGISEYQQNKERVTKLDLKQSEDKIINNVQSGLNKKNRQTSRSN